MHEEHKEKEKVSKGAHTKAQATGTGPDKCGRQLKQIVHVAGQSIVTAGDEEILPCLAIGCLVGRLDEGGGLAPHRCCWVGAHAGALHVSVVVDVDCSHTNNGSNDHGRLRKAEEISRVGGEVDKGCSVEAWNIRQATPEKVVATAVMSNVHGGKVAPFPPKELGEVHDEKKATDSCWCNAVTLIGTVRVHGTHGNNATPKHHANATVDDLLERDAKESWVKVLPHIEVNDRKACLQHTALWFNIRGEASLQKHKAHHKESKVVERNLQRANHFKNIDDGFLWCYEQPADDGTHGQDPAGNTIVLVSWAITHWTWWALDCWPRDEDEQTHLKCNEPQHVAPHLPWNGCDTEATTKCQAIDCIVKCSPREHRAAQFRVNHPQAHDGLAVQHDQYNQYRFQPSRLHPCVCRRHCKEPKLN
eukprot:m.354512 g.354512  ORF g.354512 m.354512 type:complete len:418 (+) comp17039_c0_seq1:1875-3128(+)